MSDDNLLLQENGYPNAPDIKALLRDRGKYSMNSHGNDMRLHFEAARVIEQLERELAEARKDAELLALLPSSYYMDPPDGGSVSVLEQLQRMAKDAERYRWMRNHTEQMLGACFVPCIAIPSSECSGNYASHEDADNAIDAAMKDKP